jgi:hypothetical protein
MEAIPAPEKAARSYVGPVPVEILKNIILMLKLEAGCGVLWVWVWKVGGEQDS